MAIALILFCVFQVMTAVINASITLSSLPSVPASSILTAISSPLPSTLMPSNLSSSTDNIMAEEDAKHGKRSLNRYPFTTKFIGTQSRTLVILPNGTVQGVKRMRPEYGIVEIFTACLISAIQPSLDLGSTKEYGKISIKGKLAGRFVCMNEYGDVYSSENCSDECNFKQKGNGPFHVYYSLKHRGRRPNKTMLGHIDGKKKRNKKWFLAIHKRTGQMLKGWRAKHNRHSTQFIERPVQDAGYKETRYQQTTATKDPVLQSEIDKEGNIHAGNGEMVLTPHTDSPTTSPNNRKNNRNRQRPRNRNRNRNNRKKQPGRRDENCDEGSNGGGGGGDPLDLFRIKKVNPCQTNSNSRRGGSSVIENRQVSNPFSTSTHRRRHQSSRDGSSSTTNPTRKQFNLFSFPMR